MAEPGAGQPSGADPSPTPLLRPNVSRAASGPRTPRLGLAIPPSSTPNKILPPEAKRRAGPPQLKLATPQPAPAPVRPVPQQSSAAGSENSSRSRSDSFTMIDGKASNPTSASSSAYSIGKPGGDPASAISSAYSDAGGTLRQDQQQQVLVDLEKLSLEKGRELDIDDLDDNGWRTVSEQKRIVELGSLGEGAGGAVTRCKLVGGKTEFALKVGLE